MRVSARSSLKRYDALAPPPTSRRPRQRAARRSSWSPREQRRRWPSARLYLASGRHEQAEAVFSRPGGQPAAGRRGRGWDSRRPWSAKAGRGGRAQLPRGHRARARSTGDTYDGLAVFLFSAGRAGEAIASYRKSAALTPGNASALNNLGAALLMDGQVDEARADLREVAGHRAVARRACQPRHAVLLSGTVPGCRHAV